MTELGTPNELGLPFTDWWPNQRQMVERALSLNQGEVLFLEAPTGTGKSVAPASVSAFRPGLTVLVATRDLQRQYANSFGFPFVWGQAHYPCILDSRVKSFLENWGMEPSRADCPFRHIQDCPAYSDCPYEAAKCTASTAQARVLNYAYAYYSDWWREPHDLFCDEAHALPDLLAGLISFEVKERTRYKYGLSEFPPVTGSSPYALTSALSWFAQAARSVAPSANTVDPQGLSARRFYLTLKGLTQSLESAESGEWFVVSGQGLGRISARPVWPGPFASRILNSKARSIVLMSATIGEPAVLAQELGLNGQTIQALSLPHIFPPQNRPVIWITSSPKLSYKTGEAEYKEQARIIAGIIKQHAGQRGIIHTASWSHAKRLMTLLSNLGLAERLYLPEGERLEALEKFYHSLPGTVAISPSWHEGLNFPDDSARFCVIAKIPFLSLADPVVKLRLESEGGRRWYDWNACLVVAQAAGRIVRHAEDWGVTYICDSHWARVAKYAPKWFQVEQI